jgi:hypothetical protein
MNKIISENKFQTEKRLELFDVLYNFRRKHPTTEILIDDSNYNIITIYLPISAI